ncbi:hypothetical protein TSUD_180650 [Trifolium subterraneum]|uniref:PA domain-containing protein n=1 Tax=Trifolium subterraneum TaxID=3900 RepID=A0A2Z6NJE2_TRISU|nr:hypothetical protein TSUD_180650 [Trifolium subterraneum]
MALLRYLKKKKQQIFQLHTTRSWEFLGLQRNGKNTAWQKGNFGENTIIANVDSGVWPESKSFSDNGFGPIPSKWRGRNACQIRQFRNLKKNPCNRPGTLDPLKVKGKIVGCDREGNIKSVAEGQEALTAGAKGMLLSNRPQQGKTTLAEPHVLSCVGGSKKEFTKISSNTTELAESHAAYDITSM